jgi:acyl-CoA hydrolase
LVIVRDKIGTEIIRLDPAKIIGMVRTNIPDQSRSFTDSDSDTDRIGENVAKSLSSEIRSGRIPPQFLPIQSGVGNIANAILKAMSVNPLIPPDTMYSEVLQDFVIDSIKSGDLLFANGAALAVTKKYLDEIYDNYDLLKHA